MEKISEKISTKKVKEYTVECEKCGKKIIGSTEKQVGFLLMVHKHGSKCKND